MPLITSSIKIQLTEAKSKIIAQRFKFSTELSMMLLIQYWFLDFSDEEAWPIGRLTGQ